MGAFKDIVNLFKQLNGIMLKIQTALETLEQESTVRASEIAELKKKVFELEKKYSSTEAKPYIVREESPAQKPPDKLESVEEEISEPEEKIPASKWQNIYKFFEDKFSAPKEKHSTEKPPPEFLIIDEEYLKAREKFSAEKLPEEQPEEPAFVDEKVLTAQEKSDAEELPEKPEVVEETQPVPKEKSAAEILQEKYEFVQQFSICKSKESGRYFCPSCLMKGIESPLTEKFTGWQCEFKECGEFYVKPGYKTTKGKEGGRRPFQW
ncbi:MAG: hypothetical protein JW914_10650 [Syntrophaceae bacterium]|nr:hypothetical protein [Syntrophaceae bacterium]